MLLLTVNPQQSMASLFTHGDIISDMVRLTFILHRIVHIFAKNWCGIQTRRLGRMVWCI